MKKTPIQTLNSAQKEAVVHKNGPLIIIAGAGTGKTHVITERIKFLLSENLAKPSEILGLTFTEKAACEMEERVDVALPYGYTQLWIMTFHAFGEKILRQEGLHIGLNPAARLMTGAESTLFFRRNLFKFHLNYFRPLGNPQKFIEAMLTHFSRLKDEDVSPKEYLLFANKQITSNKEQEEEKKIEAEKYLELAKAYEMYETLKVKEGMMDFSDLISNALLLLRTRKNILKEYQSRFKYILIDEFQDTNFAQNELAVLLAGERKNITCVADDDQSVYRWRGAAVSNVIQFRKTFPNSKLIVLRENYRSTQEILDRSYRLIQFNNPDRLEVKEKIDKKLTSQRKIQGEKIELLYCNHVEEEAEKTVSSIKYLVLNIKDKEGKPNYRWKDIAILVRANNHAEPFVKALQRAGVPYQFLGPGRLLRQPEVKDLIAYLKILNNPEDSVSLYRILTMPIFNFSARELISVLSFSKKTGITLFEALDAISSVSTDLTSHWSIEKNIRPLIPNLSSLTISNIVKIYTMISRHLERVHKDSAGQMLYYFLEDSELLKTFTNYTTEKEERVVLNISKFFEKLKGFELTHDDSSTSAVVEWLSMMMELGESPLSADTDWSEEDAVNILTIHSSKGLEFPVVFLVNLVQNRFPTNERAETIPIPDALVKEILPEGDYHMEEERRLFYVGMTRARDRLFFTAANYYGEGKRERKISPFVVETLGEVEITRLRESRSGEVKKDTIQLSFLDFKKKEEITLPLKPNKKSEFSYLSFSQIETYNTCPLQYKYRYILRIPVPPTAAGSFGTSIHLTLQRFYEEVKRSEKPTCEHLLELLKNSWLPIGYGSKEYEDAMKKRGIGMLTNFYQKFYDPDCIPDSLEQVFKIKLTPNLTIGGKIDRVDKNPDGSLEVIDYKTGKRPTDKKIKENLQMTVYALAAADPHIYNTPCEDVTLTFYFFEANEKVSGKRTKEDLERAKGEIVKKSEEIQNSLFEAKVGPWCNFCDFKMICEAWQ